MSDCTKTQNRYHLQIFPFGFRFRQKENFRECCQLLSFLMTYLLTIKDLGEHKNTTEPRAFCDCFCCLADWTRIVIKEKQTNFDDDGR